MREFINTVKREVTRLASRRVYLWAMMLVPLLGAFFFASLMREGLPKKIPSAIVDLDGTQFSSTLSRSLAASELIDVQYTPATYHEAMELLDRGEIYGFFLIPHDFEADALGGRTPSLAYYSNMTYFVPGTLSYKAFKTMAVTTSGAIVETSLVDKGVPGDMAATILQPMVVDAHPVGNPWVNYNYYLSNSFLPGLIELMVMLVTVFSICQEIKRATSPQWLHTAGGSLTTALLGKLLPQTLIFTVIGWGCEAYFYCYLHFPCHHPGAMIAAMPLLVIASQSLALVVVSAVPNLRLGLALCSLLGILAFSIAGFSFPVEDMYGAVGIFSYILPVRWFFLIYADQALNGIALYYSRFYFVALLVFPIVATLMAPMLKKRLMHPVYVP